jgi:uncharacterized repeat protein (TIGR03803 family)
MLGKSSLMKRSAVLVLLALGVLLGAARAQTESVLYSFCPQYPCADGEFPYAGVVFDQKGNLYGTTRNGGTQNNNCGYGCGVVFKLTPRGKETVLYSFCAQGNCADGAQPFAGLVFDQKGNLYGTTYLGGASNGGVVFKLTPKGKYTVLYSFCSQSGRTDGEYPAAGLVFDPKGNLYGSTYNGGAYNAYCSDYGCGVVFKLTPKGKYTVLYSFCAQTTFSFRRQFEVQFEIALNTENIADQRVKILDKHISLNTPVCLGVSPDVGERAVATEYLSLHQDNNTTTFTFHPCECHNPKTIKHKLRTSPQS